MLGSFEVVAPTGINESLTLANLEAFPNPCVESITVKNLPLQSNYSIISLTGRLCEQSNYSGKIDVTALRRGIYFIRIEGYEERVLRFIKN